MIQTSIPQPGETIMKGSTILLNLCLVLLAIVVPRIPSGGTSFGDPILQILYIVIILPVMATLLNLILSKAGKNRWPRITTYLVCLLGSIAAYMKWVLKSDYTFLRTDSEMTFAFLFLASVGLATVMFAILHATGSGRIRKTAETS